MRRSGTSRGLLAAVLIAGLPVAAGTTAPVGAQSGADAVSGCQAVTATFEGEDPIPEVRAPVCKSLEAGLWLGAQTCRRHPVAEEHVCPSIDGRRTGTRAMGAYRDEWTARALDLQRQLDLDVPLVQALIPHTHNSANSAAYRPSVTTLDANQIVSLTDQLELGFRGIEIDLHWVPYPDPAGDPDRGYRDVVQCHGRTEQTGVVPVHVGCSVDHPLAPLLAEIRTWLGAKGNEGEVVLLYLENQLDEDPAAHARAAELIEQELGELVHRPEAGGCRTLPVRTISKRELVTGGGRVLITGNCGPEDSPWNEFVFDRGNGSTWDESGGTTGYECDSDRDHLLTRSGGARHYENTFVRRYEDSTWVSAMTGGGSHITSDVLAGMVGCDVNLPGLDQVHPGDDRLAGLVWSWKQDEPADGTTGACAAQGADARFSAAPCDALRPVACRTAVGDWAVSTEAVEWASADQVCRADGHVGAGVPFNGWDNGLLRTAASGRGDVWLAYGQDADGNWVTGVPDPSEPPAVERPGRGHGGKPSQPGPPPDVEPATRPERSIQAVPASSDGASDMAVAALLLLGLGGTVIATARRRRR